LGPSKVVLKRKESEELLVLSMLGTFYTFYFIYTPKREALLYTPHPYKIIFLAHIGLSPRQSHPWPMLWDVPHNSEQS